MSSGIFYIVLYFCFNNNVFVGGKGTSPEPFTITFSLISKLAYNKTLFGKEREILNQRTFRWFQYCYNVKSTTYDVVFIGIRNVLQEWDYTVILWKHHKLYKTVGSYFWASKIYWQWCIEMSWCRLHYPCLQCEIRQLYRNALISECLLTSLKLSAVTHLNSSTTHNFSCSLSFSE